MIRRMVTCRNRGGGHRSASAAAGFVARSVMICGRTYRAVRMLGGAGWCLCWPGFGYSDEPARWLELRIGSRPKCNSAAMLRADRYPVSATTPRPRWYDRLGYAPLAARDLYPY